MSISLQEVADSLNFTSKKSKTDKAVYGEVKAINPDKTYQVSLNGSDTTVKCARLSGAKIGDTVLVEILSNGYAVVTGTVGGDTDASDAKKAADIAVEEAGKAQTAATEAAASASEAATSAGEAATAAQGAADSASAAETSASEAADAASQAVADADSAAASATQAASDASSAASSASSAADSASQAAQDAADAEEAAGTAKQAADTALVELANVQDVAGVLEWITNHGEMVSQSGGTFNPYEVYFILDPNGVYEVQGSNYSIVSEPKAEEIDDYFVLNVDKSIQNYVSTHIAVNSEGLWLIPEDDPEHSTPETSSRKILIAVGGEDHRYPEAGTYIINTIDGADKIMAKFTENAVQVGEDGKARLEMTTNNMTSYNADNVPFFDVDYDGGAITTKSYTTLFINLSHRARTSAVPSASSGTIQIMLIADGMYRVSNIISVVSTSNITAEISGSNYIKLSNLTLQDFVLGVASSQTASVRFMTSRGEESFEVLFDYDGKSRLTVEGEATSPLTGQTFFVPLGITTTVQTKGPSFSFGTNLSSERGGFTSTLGEGLTAEGSHQTAIGKYNANRSSDLFEIGYGTDSTPRNVFDVDTGGEVRLAINTSASAGTTDGDLYSAIDALGWTSAVIE